MSASSSAVRRLRRDLDWFEQNPNPQIVVKPSSQSMLEWHFVLHTLPLDTPYADGCYHGRLVFPERYPLAPPSLFMVTLSGRFETGRPLCLSMTDFHPESWNPAWTVESLLVGVLSFMLDDRDTTAVGSLKESDEKRRRLARESWAANAGDATFRELFPDFLGQLVARPPLERLAEEAGHEPALVELEVREDEVCSEGVAQVLRTVVVEASLGGVSSHMVSGELQVEDMECEYITVPMEPPPIGLPMAEGAGQPPRLIVVDMENTLDATAPNDNANTGDDPEGARAEQESQPSHSSSRPSRQDCWICREDNTEELLIQPCACRGSMSGVHASCVEAWVAHHRATSGSDRAPRCSVCGQEYTGTETKPGFAQFLKHICGDFFMQCGRSTLLVAMLITYWLGSHPTMVKSVALRVLCILVSGLFFVFKTLVLAVSLPWGRPPPEDCSRMLFRSDFRTLATMIAEQAAMVVVCCLWCVYGQLVYQFVVPLLSLVFLPVVTVAARHRRAPCTSRSVMMVLMVVFSPLIMLFYVVKMLWDHPKRLANPFDGLLHALVPVVSIPLCWLHNSSVPAVVIWTMHSCVLLLGFAERRCLRQANWQEGRAWWVFAQLAMLTAYVGNVLHNFTEGFGISNEAALVAGVSGFWLLLCIVLAFSVNWRLCVEQYHTWQHRNGSFSLSPAGTPRRNGQAGPAQAQTFGAAVWDEDQIVGVGRSVKVRASF
mmetsp:Transcript_45110/g.144060  ORF Transcript_45110/g.144060 Transcript_45110/m.144060 type:complete len:716 (+) Transcript_45110:777-2924(+)